ncbi:MAG: sulfotransferase [Candidatus Omnitrophica bacterium]|nr:sulfotransferase [Candidatus Omnitrophota bacterium]
MNRTLQRIRTSLSKGAILSRYRRSKYTFNIRRLYVPLKNVSIDRPIFFLGVQGGGLTMIVKALQRHHNTCFCTGNSYAWDAADNEIFTCNKYVPPALSFLNNDVYHPYYKTDYFRYWTYALDDTIDLYRMKSDSIDSGVKDEFRAVLKRIIRAYAHDIHNCRFIDKSQLYTINAHYLYKILEDTQPYFILVTRDPFAMCKRVAEKYYANPKKNNFTFSQEKNLRLCCQHWKNSIEIALKDGEHIPNFKVVQFEQFLKDPRHFLKDICEFVKLPFDETIVPGPDQKNTIFTQMQTRWYPMREDVNEQYIRTLEQDEIKIIEEICGHVAHTCGYETPSFFIRK